MAVYYSESWPQGESKSSVFWVGRLKEAQSSVVYKGQRRGDVAAH